MPLRTLDASYFEPSVALPLEVPFSAMSLNYFAHLRSKLATLLARLWQRYRVAQYQAQTRFLDHWHHGLDFVPNQQQRTGFPLLQAQPDAEPAGSIEIM